MNNKFKRMKQLAGIKEITLQPKVDFSSISKLAEYIENNPKFKTALIDAIYEAAVPADDDGGWNDIKQEFINNPVAEQDGYIEFDDDMDDYILVSLTPTNFGGDNDDFSRTGTVDLYGHTFYYAFV